MPQASTTAKATSWPPNPPTGQVLDACAERVYRGHRIAVDRILVDGVRRYRPMVDDDYAGGVEQSAHDALHAAKAAVNRREGAEPTIEVGAWTPEQDRALRDAVRNPIGEVA